MNNAASEIPRETNIQPSVAWVKLNIKWIRGKEREGGGGVWAKQALSKLYKLLPLRFPAPPSKQAVNKLILDTGEVVKSYTKS